MKLRPKVSQLNIVHVKFISVHPEMNLSSLELQKLKCSAIPFSTLYILCRDLVSVFELVHQLMASGCHSVIAVLAFQLVPLLG